MARGQTIGDLFVSIKADLDTLQREMEHDAPAVGDKVGKTLGERIGKALKTGAFAIAGGFGAALGAATIGRFAALSRAVAEFQRETGATAEEAKAAGQAINDMAGRNLQPIEEIGQTLARVTTDWGLHGDAAAAAADQVLKYARATGQDAAEATSALDDIMDNWNITADHAGEIMDKLIVSHQRYGGSLEQNQASLAGLAPAMRAANFEIDDGIELLGLFGSKGLDANQGAAAFAKALTKVKSPAELQALIDDISNTTDSFARARKAADLFGARAGAKLANALGGANLDDYAVSLDDAAGATDRAADASETMADKVVLAFRNMTSQVVGFFGENGDLIMGISGFANLLGPVLRKAGAAVGVIFGAEAAKKIGSQISEVLGASKFIEAIGISGSAAGLAWGTAFLASAVSAALIVGQLTEAIQKSRGPWEQEIDAALLDLAKSTGRPYQELVKRFYDDLAAEMANPLNAIGAFLDSGLIERKAREVLARIQTDTAAAATDVGGALGTGMVQGAKRLLINAAFTLSGDAEVRNAHSKMWDHWYNQMLRIGARKTAARSKQANTPVLDTFVNGILGDTAAGLQRWVALRAGDFQRAMAQLRAQVTADVKEQARLLANGFMENVGAALEERARKPKDINKAIRDINKSIHDAFANREAWKRNRDALQAEVVKLYTHQQREIKRGNTRNAHIYGEGLQEIVKLWEAQTGKAWDWGKSITANFARGTEKNKGKPKTVAQKVNEAVEKALRAGTGATGAMYKGGAAVASSWGSGLFTNLTTIANVLESEDPLINPMAKIRKILGGSLPEAGPLVGAEKGGAELMSAWFSGAIESARSGAADFRNALGLATAATMSPFLMASTIEGASRTVRVVHELDAGSARQLREAGFDDRAIAGYLAAPGEWYRQWEDV